jgi:phosphate transport system protein
MASSHAHARGTLDREIGALREKLLALGEMADDTIADAMQALREVNTQLAQRIIDGDAVLNDLRFQIEESCLSIIATQQPAAGDLRQVVAAMNIVVDLERIGDHAAGVAKTVHRMEQPYFTALPESLERMAALTQQMLRQVLQVYAESDVDRAYNVARMDDRIDSSYQTLFRELLEQMLHEHGLTTNALYLLFAGHNLERIGDRVTNIAERVIFTSSGEMHELNPEPDDARVS